MPDESQIPPQGGDDPNPDTEATQTGGAGPGAGEAGIVGVALLALYLIFFTLFVVYTLVKIWPVPTPSRENPPTATASPSPSASARPSPAATTSPTPIASATQAQTVAGATQSPTASPTPSPSPSTSPSAQPSTVTIFGYPFELWDEQRLLLLVILGGALGTLVHCLRSVYWYIGYRNLVKSWMPMYFMMPFAGAALSLVFYLVVRGGFFSPQSSFQQTSPFGFAAFAALVGLFSTQAVLKLKDVAEVLWTKPESGSDARPQQTVTPSVSGSAESTSSVSETPKVGGNPSGKG